MRLLFNGRGNNPRSSVAQGSTSTAQGSRSDPAAGACFLERQLAEPLSIEKSYAEAGEAVKLFPFCSDYIAKEEVQGAFPGGFVTHQRFTYRNRTWQVFGKAALASPAAKAGATSPPSKIVYLAILEQADGLADTSSFLPRLLPGSDDSGQLFQAYSPEPSPVNSAPRDGGFAFGNRTQQLTVQVQQQQASPSSNNGGASNANNKNNNNSNTASGGASVASDSNQVASHSFSMEDEGQFINSPNSAAGGGGGSGDGAFQELIDFNAAAAAFHNGDEFSELETLNRMNEYQKGGSAENQGVRGTGGFGLRNCTVAAASAGQTQGKVQQFQQQIQQQGQQRSGAGAAYGPTGAGQVAQAPQLSSSAALAMSRVVQASIAASEAAASNGDSQTSGGGASGYHKSQSMPMRPAARFQQQHPHGNGALTNSNSSSHLYSNGYNNNNSNNNTNNYSGGNGPRMSPLQEASSTASTTYAQQVSYSHVGLSPAYAQPSSSSSTTSLVAVAQTRSGYCPGGGTGPSLLGGASAAVNISSFMTDLVTATDSAVPLDRYKAFLRLFSSLRRQREAEGMLECRNIQTWLPSPDALEVLSRIIMVGECLAKFGTADFFLDRGNSNGSRAITNRDYAELLRMFITQQGDLLLEEIVRRYPPAMQDDATAVRHLLKTRCESNEVFFDQLVRQVGKESRVGAASVVVHNAATAAASPTTQVIAAPKTLVQAASQALSKVDASRRTHLGALGAVAVVALWVLKSRLAPGRARQKEAYGSAEAGAYGNVHRYGRGGDLASRLLDERNVAERGAVRQLSACQIELHKALKNEELLSNDWRIGKVRLSWPPSAAPIGYEPLQPSVCDLGAYLNRLDLGEVAARSGAAAALPEAVVVPSVAAPAKEVGGAGIKKGLLALLPQPAAAKAAAAAPK